MADAGLDEFVSDLEAAGANVYEVVDGSDTIKARYHGRWRELRRAVENDYFCVDEQSCDDETSIILQPIR